MRKILSVYGIAMILGSAVGLVASLLIFAIQKTSQLLHHFFQFGLAHDWPIVLISSAVTVVMVLCAWWLTMRFAPTASGSGIPEIEIALSHQGALIPWYRMLPVKFLGAVLGISSQLILGREGPSVQMGGYLGSMFADFFRLRPHRCDVLIAAGSAAGLAAAFNAPLAGILFFLEELRVQHGSFTEMKIVAIACTMSIVVLHFLMGDHPAIIMPIYASPDLLSLTTFFLLGIVMGFLGICFNQCLIQTLNWVEKLSFLRRLQYVMLTAVMVGYLAAEHPLWVGGGYAIIAQSIDLQSGVLVMIFVLVIRFVLGMFCYSTGVPGGIFAPILALGTLMGLIVFQCMPHTLTDSSTQQGMFAVAGMGGLFAASVRAPFTGILLVVEMTQNYSLILPLMITCLTATTVSQCMHNAPIYSRLCARMLH